MMVKNCIRCGKEFTRKLRGQTVKAFEAQKYCSVECKCIDARINARSAKDDARFARVSVARKIAAKEGKKAEVTRYGVKHWDAEVDHPANVEQRQFDRMVDTRLNVQCDARVFTAEEIAAINSGRHPLAGSITPIGKIRSTKKQSMINIHADLDPAFKARRYTYFEEQL